MSTDEAVGVTTNNTAAHFLFVGRVTLPIPPPTIESLSGGIYSNIAGNPGSLLEAFNSVECR